MGFNREMLVKYCIRHTHGWMIVRASIEILKNGIAGHVFDRRFERRERPSSYRARARRKTMISNALTGAAQEDRRSACRPDCRHLPIHRDVVSAVFDPIGIIVKILRRWCAAS